MRLTKAVILGALAVTLCARGARAQTTPPSGEDEPKNVGENEADAGNSGGIESGDYDDYAKVGKRKRIKPEYGVGLRLRGVFEPKFVPELFVEKASSGMFHPGFGLELIRRKENFELVLGFEYENVSPKDGWWLENGDDGVTPGQYPDYTDFDGLAWLTADLAFMFQSPINEHVAFRYGAGFGLGIVMGDVLRTDAASCTGTDFENDCTAVTSGAGGAQFKDPEDLPPVFPVVDLIVGMQFRPTKKWTINLETGLRTVFFFGLSSAYFF